MNNRYANKTKWWGDEGFDVVCKTVKYLINEINRIIPEIEELIKQEKFEVEQFHYPPFNNSVEVIP